MALASRLNRIAKAFNDRIYRREADRLAREHGGAPREIEAELRAFTAELYRRFGADPDWDRVVETLAAEHGHDPTALRADLAELRARRAKRLGGTRHADPSA